MTWDFDDKIGKSVMVFNEPGDADAYDLANHEFLEAVDVYHSWLKSKLKSTF